MEREQLLEMLEQLSIVCQQINHNITQNNPDSKLVYEVLQLSDLAKPDEYKPIYKTLQFFGLPIPNKPDPRKIVQTVSDFYNNNWTGNRDFMHIPNYQQVMENIMKYPIIIAREKGKSKILAISTIKYDENTSEQMDPYFPVEGAKYFSVTGILTHHNSPYRGLGKKIYEIALRGACGYAKTHPGTRMMCVIDSRNSPSLRALSTAVERIGSEESVGPGKELPAHVVGYYELKDSEKNLIEAPTLVLEVGLEPKDKSSQVKKGAALNFSNSNDTPLFVALQQELKSRFIEFGIKEPIVMQDEGEGTVFFHSFMNDCDITKTTIVSNGTEKGNNRESWKVDPTQYIQGPVITYFKEMNYDDEPEL